MEEEGGWVALPSSKEATHWRPFIPQTLLVCFIPVLPLCLHLHSLIHVFINGCGGMNGWEIAFITCFLSFACLSSFSLLCGALAGSPAHNPQKRRRPSERKKPIHSSPISFSISLPARKGQRNWIEWVWFAGLSSLALLNCSFFTIHMPLGAHCPSAFTILLLFHSQRKRKKRIVELLNGLGQSISTQQFKKVQRFSLFFFVHVKIDLITVIISI